MRVETLRARAAWAIDKVVRGATFTLYRWEASADPVAGSRGMLYRQKTAAHDAGTAVVGHVVKELRDEQRSIIGLSAKCTGSITITYTHLKAAFPGTEPKNVVSLKDELGIDGIRYKVVELHKTGPGENDPVVFLVGFSAKPGKETEAA